MAKHGNSGGFGGGGKRGSRPSDPFRMTNMVGATGDGCRDALTNALPALIPWVRDFTGKHDAENLEIFAPSLVFQGDEYIKTNWLFRFNERGSGEYSFSFLVIQETHWNFFPKRYGFNVFPKTDEYGGPWISPMTEWRESGCLMVHPETMEAFMTKDMVHRRPIIMTNLTDWFNSNADLLGDLFKAPPGGFALLKAGDSKPIAAREQKAMLRRNAKRKPVGREKRFKDHPF
jgi:hypothetical protein